jgi:hypothetical protein
LKVSDDQPRGRPERVDLVAFDQDVGLRRRQVMGDDELREAVLERGGGVLDMALLGVEEGSDAAARKTAGVALVDGRDLRNTQEPKAVGFVPGALELRWLDRLGEVEERSGHGGHRYAFAHHPFVAGDLAAVQVDAGPSLAVAAGRCRHMDLAAISAQPPEGRRALVTEHGPRSFGENRRELARVTRQRLRADRVDVAVHGAQPPRGDPPLDRPSSHTERNDLRAGQQAALACRQGHEFPLSGGPVEVSRYMWR